LKSIAYIPAGYTLGDDARTRRRKTMAVLVVGMIVFSTFLFSLDSTRPFLFRILDYIAISAEMLSIYMLHRHKSTEALFWTIAPVLIIVQYFFLLMNGNSEGDILAFMLIPVAAVVVFGPERSWNWFWICIILLFAASFIDDVLPGWTSTLAITETNLEGSLFHHPLKRRFEVGEGLAMTVGAICLYLLTFSVHKQLESASNVISAQKLELEREHEKSERLLANILPASAARRLKQDPTATISDDLNAVTILFADIAGFTELAEKKSAIELVRLLNTIFTRFDQLSDKYGLEKIKTIGDAYMAAGGAPEPRHDHAEAIALMALDMLEVMIDLRTQEGQVLNIRIGIASGPAVAGVIGTRKPFYDIWGDTVNLASRMESTGVPGCIQLTESTAALLSDQFIIRERFDVDVKGKGYMKTFILER